MSTQTLETNQVKYQVISDMDAAQAAKAIASAKADLDNAKATYEERLLLTPSVWMSKASSSSIAKDSGVSRAMVDCYRRTGRILSFAQSDGIAPSEVAELVNKAFNAPGSFGANVDPVLDEYATSTDSPTWAGAVRAIKAALKPESTPKTDEEKVTDYITRISKLVTKGYQPTDEQRSLLAQLLK